MRGRDARRSSPLLLVSRLAVSLSLLTFVPAARSGEPPEDKPLAGTVSLAMGDLPPGKTVTIQFDATIADPVSTGASQVSNQGSVTGSNVATVSTDDPDTPAPSDATVTPLDVADLQVTKLDGPDPVTAGSDITYMISVNNAGPAPAQLVALTDTVPGGTTFVSLTAPGGWACTTPAVDATGTVSCSTASLGLGGVSFTLVVRVDAATPGGTVIANTATVSSTSTDPALGNESATAMTTVAASADLGITKTGPAAVFPGTDLVYTITVSNAGPDPATNVLVDDLVPVGLLFESNSGDCTTAFPCSFATIPAGESRAITTTFGVPPDYPGPDPVVNTATVSSSTVDPVSGNDQANESTPVNLSSGAVDFYTLNPCRLADTRMPAGPFGGPPLSDGVERVFDAAAGSCGIPATARALAVNVTVVGPTFAGHVRLYASGPSPPFFSSLNYGAGQIRGNNAIVSLSSSGEFTVFIRQPLGGTVHVIVDVTGYFE